MSKYTWDEAELRKAVSESFSYREVLRNLNIPTSGNNASTLKRKIREYNLSTAHFTFHPKQLKPKKPVETYLTENTHIASSKLKEKLFKSGLKENKCEICGLDTWLGRRLICQIHHINGDNTDNRLENLQILCPNCHSQTDNYCGHANTQNEEKHYCLECGRELKTKGPIYCLSCASKKRRKVDITKEKLLEVLKETGNRVQAAKYFGVSETTIRKWCNRFGLPAKAKDLKDLLQ